MSKETVNEAATREALEELNELFDSGVLGTHSDMTADEMEKVDELYFKTKAALSEPPRNCDKFRDVNTAYNQFMSYVNRENPSFTKATPLHTVWDALKWVLDSEKKEADA